MRITRKYLETPHCHAWLILLCFSKNAVNPPDESSEILLEEKPRDQCTKQSPEKAALMSEGKSWLLNLVGATGLL